MIDESHAREGHRRNYLRRAVAPNLFTSVLHPEFIPALVIANLMTPCLWEWAGKSVSDPTKPVRALQEIHHFLNQRFHHAIGETFAATWGMQEGRRLTDPDEKEASDYVMEFLSRCYEIQGDSVPWSLPLVPLLKDGQFPLYVYPTADALRMLGRRAGKRLLGVTSCLDECVLAASLALAAGICRWEDIVFVGSALHYTVYIFTSEGAVWFNARREFFTEESWKSLCLENSGNGTMQQLHARLTIVDRLIDGRGLAVFPKNHLSGERSSVLRSVTEVERFAGVEMPWLRPFPEGGGDHVFTGWEAVSEGLVKGSDGVQQAVLARARAGGSPLLDAALYMFRHPEFCHPEVLRHAARKNYFAYLHAVSSHTVDDIHAKVESIAGRESVYGSTGRIALPDEVLAFGTGNEAERNLLREIMHEHFAAR